MIYGLLIILIERERDIYRKKIIFMFYIKQFNNKFQLEMQK